MIFLIHYSRTDGHLVSFTQFDDDREEEASRAKLALEISLIESSDNNEVVLLQAASEENLRRTHGRYFGSIDELRTAERTSGDNQPKKPPVSKDPGAKRRR